MSVTVDKIHDVIKSQTKLPDLLLETKWLESEGKPFFSGNNGYYTLEMKNINLKRNLLQFDFLCWEIRSKWDYKYCKYSGVYWKFNQTCLTHSKRSTVNIMNIPGSPTTQKKYDIIVSLTHWANLELLSKHLHLSVFTMLQQKHHRSLPSSPAFVEC